MSESQRWVDGYERIGETAVGLPDTRCVYIGDREPDMIDLMRRAVELDHPADWLIRARHDRALPEGEKLFASIGTEPRSDRSVSTSCPGATSRLATSCSSFQ